MIADENQGQEYCRLEAWDGGLEKLRVQRA
jgi:hypothetical protein